jgi:O-antigen ligase
MSSINISSEPANGTIKSKLRPYSALLVLGGLGLAVVLGFMVVTGSWTIAIGLLVALPIFIVLHKYPWLAVLIWLFLVPLVTVTPNFGGRQIYWLVHRALPPVTIAIMIVASVLGINKRVFPKLGWPELAMAGYVFVSLLSILMLNDSPKATFYEFYDRVISPMCVYLIIRLWAPGEDDLKRLAPVVFLLLVIQMMVGLLSWYIPGQLPSSWIDEESRTIGTVGSYGAYAATMLFCGLFLLQSAMNRKTGWVRILYLFSFALAGFGVFMSFSRGAWAAGALVILGLLLIDRKHLIQVGLVVVPLMYVLASGPLASQIDWASERLYSERSEKSALVRLPVVQASLKMLAEKPFLGWGYENFNRYDWQFYQPVQGVAAPVKDISSHNFYLTLLAEQGFIGTLLFLFPFIWWLIGSAKRIRSMPREGFWSWRSLILSWLFIFAYMTINMFHNMRTVFGLALWWVGLALIANAVTRPQESKSDSPPSSVFKYIRRVNLLRR